MILKQLIGLFAIMNGIEAFNKVLLKNRYRFQPPLCRTDDCNSMANVILSAMNKTANPCEDFYEYACGAWTNSSEQLPADRAIWNRVTMYSDKIFEKHRVILESTHSDAIPVEKAKRWYRSCMDEASSESHGIEPLTSIASAVGGWPIAMALGEWNPSDYTWQEIELYYSRIMGSYALYNLDVSKNINSYDTNVITLREPEIPLRKATQQHMARKFFHHEDKLAYDNLIRGVARAFATAQGSRVSDEKIAREAEDMIQFEIQLDEIRGKDGTSIHNISKMQEILDGSMTHTKNTKINLLQLAQNLVQNFGDIEITDEEMISVKLAYINDLRILLNGTSFRTIVNYIHWHYLSRVLYATNAEMTNLLFEFMKHSFGITKQLPRWNQCIYYMELNHALSYQFVSNYFTEEINDAGTDMILKIQTELEKQINETSWMDLQMQDFFRDKLRNVKAFIGYPDWYKNSTALIEYYEGLTITNDYFTNVLNNMRFQAKKKFQALRDSNDTPEWFTDAITINAFYIMRANSLNIPAAVFQPPIFTSQMPDAVKYGIIGSIVGHELSHGFDDIGRNFDKNGNIAEWSFEMAIAYSIKALCFIQQFDNMTNSNFYDKIISGPPTIGENIADTMGVQAVFDAYKSIVQENIKGDRKLPGLEEFTNEQLFLLSYATIWCEMSTPQYDSKRLLTGDPHSSSRVRVLSTMSNTKGFAKAFNCPEESPMNPPVKCSIWGEGAELW